jgi:subtilisin family serine protease
MIRPIHYCTFCILYFILIFYPSHSLGKDYKEYLIRITDSLAIELEKATSPPEQIFTLKQRLGFSENTTISRITDLPGSELSGWYHVRLLESRQQEMKIAGETTLLEHTQENHSFKVHQELPNDPHYPDQWYHFKVEAIESWNQYLPSEDIVLAIIDTGIDYNHPDLDGSLWINHSEDLNGNGRLDAEDLNNIDDDENGYVDDVVGWDFTDAPRFADGGDYLDPDNDPMDEYLGGHGTRIAGIIAAQTVNAIGIAALTPGAKVMNLRAGTAGGYLEEDDVARALLYSIRNGAKVINMSFGDVVISRFLKDAIKYAYSEGITLIASSGNSGTDVIHYPSGLPQVISVGASDRSDQVAGFSNWGPTIDLVAPGVEILTARAGGGYDFVNGTSFSAPMVTATAGLLLSENPKLTTDQIRSMLQTSADDIGIRGWDTRAGAGRLNMKRASLISKKSGIYINYPQSGSSFAADSIPLVITATDPDLISLNVSYGIGIDPAEWINHVTDHRYQLVEDTISFLSIKSLPDTTVLIKLSVTTWSGETVEYHSVLEIDRTEPVISNVRQLNVFDSRQSTTLIEFKTDDITSADIFYRSAGSNDLFEVQHLEYETNHHFTLLQSMQNMEYYIRVTNLSGLSVIDNNSGNYYTIVENNETIVEEEFTSVPYRLPAGFMLDEIVDFDADGNPEAVISVYDESGSFGPVTIFEFIDNEFVKQYETPFKGIPRSFGDSDRDGKKELLIGYGQQSYLIEATEPGNWPTEVVWSDTGDIWVSRITDLDADGINEIIAKKGQTFIMLEASGDNIFQQKYVFENLSLGENQLGPPRTEVTDLDNDGNLELYFGDYDGDLIIYENSGNDMFEPGRYIPLNNGDATNYFVSGNLVSSGQKKLIVGTHTGSSQLLEHQVEGLYWDYSILSALPENGYDIEQHLYIHGYANVRDFESGINTGYLSTENSEYILLAPYPDLYVFKSENGNLLPVWYRNNINTNTILVHDFDQNGISEFYINDGKTIIGFEKNISLRPRPPHGFEVFPLDTNIVSLTWEQSQNADRYVIYRGLSADNLLKIDSTSSNLEYIDSSVVNNQRYFYALQTVDMSFEIKRSKIGNVQSVKPNTPPTVDTLTVKNNSQLEIYFSEQMDPTTLKAQNFIIRSEDNPTTSAIPFLNGKAVLLSFSTPFLQGNDYHIEMTALRDTNRTPLPDRESMLMFNYSQDLPEKPYVKSWDYENDRSLILFFSVPMNPSTVSKPENYTLEPSGSIESVESIDDLQQRYRLRLSRDTYRLASGVTTYISFKHLQSEQGVTLEDGNRIALVATRNSIDDLMVYPQPAVVQNGWLMFSNIAEGTLIKIFDINGHLINQLEEVDQNGGVRWNLRDQSGNTVSSGIYIYHATFDNQTKLGKLTVVK